MLKTNFKANISNMQLDTVHTVQYTFSANKATIQTDIQENISQVGKRVIRQSHIAVGET